ncbi:MAG: calcium-binding EGF-like domain-containing protein [Saprospiraceae bacterium]|nr:calcium-binding EGF-like domain-containing protein [Saprospiraceae bacterium]
MIKYKFTILLFIATLLCFSCAEKDPCEGVTCQNGGTCFEGKCQCLDGFEGNSCETEKLPTAVNVSTLKITKFPSKKQNGANWDDDGTNPDLFPGLVTLKADNTADKFLWLSDLTKLNATLNQEHNFPLLLPKLIMNNYESKLAFFLYEEDGSSSRESMGGISFLLKDVVKGKPSIIKLDCPTCTVALELSVTYE